MAFLLLSPAATASPDDLPRGEWHSTDLRGLEVLAGGTCIRVWLEERTYSIFSAGDARFGGVYSNMIRAAPVGLPSFRPECKFPPPTQNPVATQLRGWSILGRKTPEGTWRVTAEPAAPGGDFHVDKTAEFATTLHRQGNLLVDSMGGSEDSAQALFFRPPGSPPAAARTALEDTVQRLHSGACLEVAAKLNPAPGVAAEMCAIRQRLLPLSGALLSISVDVATELDRVPVGFPLTPGPGYRRQRGVFFSFLGRYEKAQVPGWAVVMEEEGTWNVALLWF